MLYVSYAILLFKNILGTYVVMSSIFKTGQGVNCLWLWISLTGPHLGSSVLFLVSGDDQVALGG